MALQLTSLPVEIISNILEGLYPEDLARLEITCRFMKDCSRQDVLWTSPCNFWSHWNPSTLENNKTWRERYITRTRNDIKIQLLVDACVRSPDLIANTPVFQEIANKYGEEAAEPLMVVFEGFRIGGEQGHRSRF